MGKSLFSVPIFIIAIRESVEASIILSVLLALVEQIVRHNPSDHAALIEPWSDKGVASAEVEGALVKAERQELAMLSTEERQTRLIKRLRIQIFAGTLAGLLVSLCIGAAFLAVYYTSLQNLYGSSEELWEGIFSAIACVMIFVMGLTMMRIDRAKIKWKVKLSRAFEATGSISGAQSRSRGRLGWLKTMFNPTGDGGARSSKYLLFFLPFVTVMREGLEAVVFIGGVSLGQSASSIPIAAIVGILCGLIFGFFIYRSSSRINLSIFLVVSTAFLMFIGAGLLAKTAYFFILNDFVKMVGGDAAEAGNGPGSFPVDGMIWHVNYGNPELNTASEGGWQIFFAVFGWLNTGYYWTVLLYIGYWLAVVVALVYMKWSEGRTAIFGYQSAAYKARVARQSRRASTIQEGKGKGEEASAGKAVTGASAALASDDEVKIAP